MSQAAAETVDAGRAKPDTEKIMMRIAGWAGTLLGVLILVTLCALYLGGTIGLGYAIGYFLNTWLALFLGCLFFGIEVYLVMKHIEGEFTHDGEIAAILIGASLLIVSVSTILTVLITRPGIMRGVGEVFSVFLR